MYIGITGFVQDGCACRHSRVIKKKRPTCADTRTHFFLKAVASMDGQVRNIASAKNQIQPLFGSALKFALTPCCCVCRSSGSRALPSHSAGCSSFRTRLCPHLAAAFSGRAGCSNACTCSSCRAWRNALHCNSIGHSGGEDDVRRSRKVIFLCLGNFAVGSFSSLAIVGDVAGVAQEGGWCRQQVVFMRVRPPCQGPVPGCKMRGTHVGRIGVDGVVLQH